MNENRCRLLKRWICVSTHAILKFWFSTCTSHFNYIHPCLGPKSLWTVTDTMTLRCLLLGRKAMTNLDSVLKSRDITLPTKVSLVKAMAFSVVIWMWELDHNEGRVLKNWCFWTVVLEKTFESPLDCKEIQPVHPKGDLVLGVLWKDWCWSWNSNTSATWCEELTHLKSPWCWETLKAGGEGDNRGLDG